MRKLTPFLLMIFLFSTTCKSQENYSELWNKVHQFEIDNLPKSALKIVDEIYNKAQKSNNSPQLVKSLFYKSKFSLTLEEDAQLKVIKHYQKHIANSKTPTKNILENILANLYWQYFTENRWKFYNRTQTNKKVDKNDFRTWDLTTLFNEIHVHYQNSLQNTKQLQKISIREFADILQLSKDALKYHPTLFDFLAQNTLSFYTTNETNITKPAYQFKLNNPAYLAAIETFSKLNITTKDQTSLQFNALKVYQQLLQFHLRSKNIDALTNIDLQRLQFVNKNGTFSNKQSLLLEALEKAKNNYKKHEASGLYAYEIAKIYNEQANTYKAIKNEVHQFKNKEALTICNTVIKQFPKSLGAKKCTSLKNQITTPTLNITSEKHLPINQYSRALVSYKNLNNLYFSLYKVTPSQIEELDKLYTEEKRINFIQKLTKLENWENNLKNEGDYQVHTTEVVIPKLKTGNYLVVATTNKDFSKETTLAFDAIQITNIAFITNHKNTNNYQVVDRNTGKPLAGAKVHLSNTPRRYGKKLDKHFTTNKNGEFTFTPNKQYYSGVEAKITHNKETAIFKRFYINPRYKNHHNEPKARIETFVFTDRSIYRPGQTIHFKGIAMKALKNKSNVVTNETAYITLKDVNHQIIKELKLTTNEFGSFSSTFTIPSNTLTGQFLIETAVSSGRNYTYISVEEYKRPKFATSFKPITDAIQVNDQVKVTGTANSFSGINITDAKVVYRVHRKIEYPRWWYWYRPHFVSEPQEIKQGETTTNDSGVFEIDFKALPDESVAKKDLPVFTYEVTADVTDINGETRSATTTIKVGYHTLIADVTLPELLNKTNTENTITVNTKNLNGEKVASKGVLKVYKLQAPNRILRKRPWAFPDYQAIPKKQFEKQFPNDAYTDEDKVTNWKKGKLVFETNVNTDTQKEINLKNIQKWASGQYICVFETKDTYGQKVTGRQFFEVFSAKDKSPADNKLINVSLDKPTYKVGEKATVTVSTHSKNITVMLFIEKKHKTVERYYIHLNKSHKKISIPISQNDLGGFSVQWYFVNYNAFDKGSLAVNVPYPKTELEITTNTLRDKLQPGTHQTWSFTVKGPKKDAVAAELLAGMYDASLDAFKQHDWYFSPIQKPRYRSYNNAEANVSFGNNSFKIQNLPYAGNSYFQSYQPNAQFNWFGFSFNKNRWTNQQYIRNLKIQRTKFDGTFTGIVENINGTPLPFVNIYIKGTKFGTTTDINGKFTLKANSGDTISISFVGYKSIEKTITNFNDTVIILEETTNSLNEVVIRGNASLRRKSSITGSATTMSDEVINNESVVAEGAMANDNSDGKLGLFDSSDIPAKKETDLQNVKARKNLQETAFFYPHLTTDKNGNVTFNFTVPEALTKWKLQLLAHTKELHSATKTLETVTQKELMVTPNAPRFLRHGDKLTLSAKISNLSTANLEGVAQLILTNPITGKNIDILNDSSAKNSFTVAKNGNTSVSWNLKVPETLDAVQYKIVAKAGDFSDGEQNALPVLTNRMLVTETLPMWIRSKETKTFALDKLKNTTSKTLRNHKLTLEVTSNPAWYAVQALPYLMEYPHECSEQIFARYYANSLASYIANSNPRIQEVFKQWKSSEALLSNLEKNQELKSLIIQETPWLREAQSESEQKKRIALLFDLNKLSNEKQGAIQKLKQLQMSNGGFPWFKGSTYPNSYITLHVASGFGHLQLLGVTNLDDNAKTIVNKAIQFLDAEIAETHRKLLEQANRIKEKDGEAKAAKYLAEKHINNFELQYLYMRSFYSKIPTNNKTEQSIAYFKKQAATYWKEFGLYSKGLIALIQHRAGDKTNANKILKSLKENSITSEELGMYWKSNQPSWNWYQSPIETQALLIEAFTEIENDIKTIDNLKIWLLKNKQVNQWKTTKATTEAVYALLLQGSDWLSVSDLVDVKVGNQTIDPTKNPEMKAEAGTGYFKTSWNTSEITPAMGTVTLTAKNNSIAWGGLYWQYFEDLDKITSSETPLQLKKKLFKKVNSDTGKKLLEVTNTTDLKVGDLLTVRIELRADRTMEFIHMKDMRASGVEPVTILSEYKWQDGLGYYESTKDASTNFFFDRLPKGVYVFEYDVRVNNAGDFSNGITTIQSMYAPEFTSHSKGIRIRVK
ncbi:Alpha-2-macroglobulin family N-terminal region [Tenacibaculum sp. 190524A02b]